jgi:hypothetical protein
VLQYAERMGIGVGKTAADEIRRILAGKRRARQQRYRVCANRLTERF